MNDVKQMKSFNIMSWNINGIRTKIEKPIVQQLLLQYDVICLYEVKTKMNISFPGYVVYRSLASTSTHRGGTVLFVKNCLNKMISNVDVSKCDQLWVQFSFMPRIMFCFAYVPPADPPYYSHEYFIVI